jgi:hypothetical protein
VSKGQNKLLEFKKTNLDITILMENTVNIFAGIDFSLQLFYFSSSVVLSLMEPFLALFQMFVVRPYIF